MLKLLKNKLNILFNKEYIEYIGLSNSIKKLKSQAYDLASLNEFSKENFNKAINFNPNLKEEVNKRYNNNYSIYLDELGIIKKKIDFFQKSINFLFERNPNLSQIILDLKKEDKNEINFVYTKYMKFNLGYKREELPQINEETLNSFLNLMDGELIVGSKIVINKIKPTQFLLNEDKIVDIINNKIKGESKAFPYIISQDNHLLDGHHNWAADLEEDENKIVDVYKINKPISYLIKRAKELDLLPKESIDEHLKTIIVSNQDFEKAVLTIANAVEENIIEKGNLNSELEGFKKYRKLGKENLEFEIFWQKLVII